MFPFPSPPSTAASTSSATAPLSLTSPAHITLFNANHLHHPDLWMFIYACIHRDFHTIHTYIPKVTALIARYIPPGTTGDIVIAEPSKYIQSEDEKRRMISNGVDGWVQLLRIKILMHQQVFKIDASQVWQEEVWFRFEGASFDWEMVKKRRKVALEDEV